jgi:hypothetical protein
VKNTLDILNMKNMHQSIMVRKEKIGKKVCDCKFLKFLGEKI